MARIGGLFITKKVKLSASMTLTEFDNGYWYASELRDFAKTIGIPFANRLRKDELENAIKLFLETGKIESPNKRTLSVPGIKDVDVGLRLDLPVEVYTNDKRTKDFLEKEAQKIPHGRYINFLSDFLKAEQGATREQAIKAWEELKTLDIPKNYRSWKNFQSSNEKDCC
jgi:hypothetical protein